MDSSIWLFGVLRLRLPKMCEDEWRGMCLSGTTLTTLRRMFVKFYIPIPLLLRSYKRDVTREPSPTPIMWP